MIVAAHSDMIGMAAFHDWLSIQRAVGIDSFFFAWHLHKKSQAVIIRLSLHRTHLHNMAIWFEPKLHDLSVA